MYICRLANSGELIQHVGFIRSDVNMKPVRASVHREARLHLNHCANQFKYGHVIKMTASSESRLGLQRRSTMRAKPQTQRPLVPAHAASKMLQILYLCAFYLVFTTNITLVAGDSGRNGAHVASLADSNLATTTEFGELIFNCIDLGTTGLTRLTRMFSTSMDKLLGQQTCWIVSTWKLEHSTNCLNYYSYSSIIIQIEIFAYGLINLTITQHLSSHFVGCNWIYGMHSTILNEFNIFATFSSPFLSFFLSRNTDYASRGGGKFGDKCETTTECGFPGSICDSKKRSCQCVEELPVTNHLDKCGKGNVINAFWHCLVRVWFCLHALHEMRNANTLVCRKGYCVEN